MIYNLYTILGERERLFQAPNGVFHNKLSPVIYPPPYIPCYTLLFSDLPPLSWNLFLCSTSFFFFPLYLLPTLILRTHFRFGICWLSNGCAKKTKKNLIYHDMTWQLMKHLCRGPWTLHTCGTQWDDRLASARGMGKGAEQRLGLLPGGYPHVQLMAHHKNPRQSSGRQHQIIKHKFPERRT